MPIPKGGGIVGTDRPEMEVHGLRVGARREEVNMCHRNHTALPNCRCPISLSSNNGMCRVLIPFDVLDYPYSFEISSTSKSEIASVTY